MLIQKCTCYPGSSSQPSTSETDVWTQSLGTSTTVQFNLSQRTFADIRKLASKTLCFEVLRMEKIGIACIKHFRHFEGSFELFRVHLGFWSNQRFRRLEAITTVCVKLVEINGRDNFRYCFTSRE